jgi:hypothetical protein
MRGGFKTLNSKIKNMKVGFHGTSIQAATAIMANGWKNILNNQNWKVSTGNAFVLTDKDHMEECFQLAFTQATSKALKEPFVSKRAVVAFDISSKKKIADTNHHKEWAYEIPESFYSWDVLAVWSDEHDISACKVFMDHAMKKVKNFIPATDLRSPVEKLLADNLKSYTLDPIHLPIKEVYRKNHRYYTWNPKELTTKL